MAGKKTISEMVGEFFREAGLLVVVFIPIDVTINGRWSRTLVLMLLSGALAIIGGIALERGRDE
jgi:hypothetical protein